MSYDAVARQALVPVSVSLFEDSPPRLVHVIDEAIDRRFRPWAYPDRNPFPTIDPAPWFTNAQAWLNEAHARLSHCRTVLRYGIPETEEW